ncbi:MAG TPA: hypothetical protein VGO00_12320 [Kofleriaceae bacterium]|jgi:hypothetical protein|nr:hypothetical protein [Kofleriaceae bacterium]
MIEDEVGARLRWFRDGAERRARGEVVPRTTAPRTRRGDRLKTLLRLGDSQLDFV